MTISKYRSFDGKRYKLYIEYPRYHSEILSTPKKLRKKGWYVRKVRTSYGYAIYIRKKRK